MRAVVALPIIALALASTPASAEGGRNAALAAGAIGGLAIGGLLGSAIAAPRPVYVEHAPVVVRRRPVYVERVYADECFTSREQVWVPGWGWEVRRRTICE